MAFLRCHDVHKDYTVGTETVRALDGVSLAIDRGEFVSVMGPSGSGKSTFMNLIGCLDRPNSGSIELDGERVSNLGERQLWRACATARSVSYSSNSTCSDAPLPWTTSPCRCSTPGVDRTERTKRAGEALARVGLDDRAQHLPSQLSGGQQQRVAIARALVNSPDMLLADEPTGALDTATGREIMNLFQTLNEAGLTVIVVTHEAEVADYARRILRFRDGVIMSDTMDEVRHVAV